MRKDRKQWTAAGFIWGGDCLVRKGVENKLTKESALCNLDIWLQMIGFSKPINQTSLIRSTVYIHTPARYILT